jgi:hypothetical protein
MFICLLVGCAGCQTYKFDILQPPVADRQIGTDQQTRVVIDPLEYRLQADEGRLVMLIYNPTSDPIQLLGGKSAVVDPDGQSHPLRDVTMASGSYVKEIFPPMRGYYGPGPSFQIGVGGIIGNAEPSPKDAEPICLDVYGDSSNYFWDWQGETDVRMTLVYARGDATFSQELAFHRVKR